MNSFILISRNKEKRDEYVSVFAKKKDITPVDIRMIDPMENSFGIADVRNIQKTAFLKPQQSKEKIIVLNNAQLLTKEAQNALLKLLEEPPQHTYIFLSSTSSAFFLPTIMSRCKEVILDSAMQISKEQTDALVETVQILHDGTIAQKLVLAEKIAADKENLLDWFEKILMALRDKMLEDPTDSSSVRLLQNMQHAFMLSQTTNVAPRMILEHCFLSL